MGIVRQLELLRDETVWLPGRESVLVPAGTFLRYVDRTPDHLLVSVDMAGQRITFAITEDSVRWHEGRV